MTARRSTVLATLVLAAALIALKPGTLKAEPADYFLDADHVSIGFLVHHIGYAKVFGIFQKAEGTFTFDEDAPAVSNISVTVETDSVFTNHKKRDQHLRSSDFLSSKKHPEMTFAGTGSEQTGPRTGKIIGDLTLRGETHPLTLDVTWNKSGVYPFGHGDYVVGISARGTVKRSLYGMTYAVENGFVGDDVELIIEFEGRRK
jgi:polyisoprenoid-binding protein YceI